MEIDPRITPGGPGNGKVPVTIVPMEDDYFLLSYGNHLFRCDDLWWLANCMRHLKSI